MSKLDKRAISILVIAILALSFALPIVSVSALTVVIIDVEPFEDSQVGDVITVSGAAEEVTSGATIKGYWDIAMGEDAWFLNSTTGNPNGSYDFEITIPDCLNGTHYIWVEDTATMDRAKSIGINITRKIKLKPSRGLAYDEFTVTGTGFSAENDVTLVFHNRTAGEPNNFTKTFTETPTTDEYGSFTVELNVPSGLAGVDNYGSFYVDASDDISKINATATYIVGASILLTPDEGPVGTLIEITGEGFNGSTLIVGNIMWDKTYKMNIVDDTISISAGKFSGEIVVPSRPTGTYEVNVSDGDVWANETFTIDGLASIEVSPTYGSPGATIELKGYNFTQIADTVVILNLHHEEEEDCLLSPVKTNADGTFETTFISPAITFATYKLWANDTAYGVNASDTFKVGIIAFIINPTYGEAGTGVGVTGIGFSPGPYNLTFGDKLYEEFGTVTGGEAISDTFYVPNVDPGTYDLTVIDTEENELTVQFRLTESSYVSVNPAVAPNEYNVSIKGYHFADVEGAVDFVIYNVTAEGEVDKEWIMDVDTRYTIDETTVTDDDGNFTGHWHVPLEDVISLGDYTINVTGSQDLLVQVAFSIVEARVSVAPRKAQFDRGDMIQFDIKNDFKLGGSYIEIYDPYDTLYWITEKFTDGTETTTDMWLQVEGLYTVPYYRQTAAENPMELQSDAPMGPWLYIFYDNKDDQLMNGTFSVGPSTAAQVEEKLTELWGSMEDLSTNIDSITDELAGDIADLSGDIDDVVADVQDMVDDITADLAEELAGVAADTEAAVGELKDSIGDIASAQNALQSELEDMSQDTAAAKEAAEDSQQTAQGLTTLVYGAIAASLIAALAAVVSLMQISKKIA